MTTTFYAFLWNVNVGAPGEQRLLLLRRAYSAATEVSILSAVLFLFLFCFNNVMYPPLLNVCVNGARESIERCLGILHGRSVLTRGRGVFLVVGLSVSQALELVQDSKATIFLVLELARGGELFDRIKVGRNVCTRYLCCWMYFSLLVSIPCTVIFFAEESLGVVLFRPPPPLPLPSPRRTVRGMHGASFGCV